MFYIYNVYFTNIYTVRRTVYTQYSVRCTTYSVSIRVVYDIHYAHVQCTTYRVNISGVLVDM